MKRWTDFLQGLPTGRATAGNRLAHIADDDEILQAVWGAIEGAERAAWLLMYALAPDRVGRGTLARLVQAARRGVDVRLVCDYAGSFELRDRDLAALREAGGHAVFFNPLWPPGRRTGGPTVRDHRKVLVTDGTLGFCGGFNLTEEYAGERYGSFTFDDTMIRVEGPCVTDLADAVRHTWFEVTGERLDGLPEAAPLDEGSWAASVAVDPRVPRACLSPVLADAVRHARERCILATPYFFPPRGLYDALLEAAGRGVEVRVLAAGETDHAVARHAAHYGYPPLLEAGARIYELQGRILHSKTLCIDGAFGSVGSFNMDAWTDRHTLEHNLLFVDPGVVRSLERGFDQDLGDAIEADAEAHSGYGVLRRLLQGTCYHACCRL